MKCPVCGLLSPTGGTLCDCGYDFKRQTGGRRIPFHIRHRAGLWFSMWVAIGVLLLIICAVAVIWWWASSMFGERH